MLKARPSRAPFETPDSSTLIQRKTVPHPFVLDALTTMAPRTRSMFGCLAIYAGDKIVLLLRNRPDKIGDNGVWLATTAEHHASLQDEFPNMRSIQLLGKQTTGWQVLPADAPDFEESALHACELVLKGDRRIGKVLKGKRPSISKGNDAVASTGYGQ
jgi:hypothetical protein